MKSEQNYSFDNKTLVNRSFQSFTIKIDKGVAFITFDYGETNILDLTSVTELVELANILEVNKSIKVIVFQSANPDYFLSHADFKLLQNFRDQGAYDGEEMPLYSAL